MYLIPGNEKEWYPNLAITVYTIGYKYNESASNNYSISKHRLRIESINNKECLYFSKPYYVSKFKVITSSNEAHDIEWLVVNYYISSDVMVIPVKEIDIKNKTVCHILRNKRTQ